MKWLVAALALLACLPARAQLPFVWNDTTGARDMPWLGSGGRARWFERDTTKPLDMDPRGPKIESRWGSSGRSGEPPSVTGNRTAAYLESLGLFKAWPTYPAEGGHRRVAFPYRVTIVCLEPTVAILRYDLSAAIEDPIEFSFGAFPPGARANAVKQKVGGAGLPNAVMFGSSVSSRGSLAWFAPEAQVPPTPLDLSSGRASIVAKGVVLELERRGDEVVVARGPRS